MYDQKYVDIWVLNILLQKKCVNIELLTPCCDKYVH